MGEGGGVGGDGGDGGTGGDGGGTVSQMYKSDCSQNVCDDVFVPYGLLHRRVFPVSLLRKKRSSHLVALAAMMDSSSSMLPKLVLTWWQNLLVESCPMLTRLPISWHCTGGGVGGGGDGGGGDGGGLGGGGKGGGLGGGGLGGRGGDGGGTCSQMCGSDDEQYVDPETVGANEL